MMRTAEENPHQTEGRGPGHGAAPLRILAYRNGGATPAAGMRPLPDHGRQVYWQEAATPEELARLKEEENWDLVLVPGSPGGLDEMAALPVAPVPPPFAGKGAEPEDPAAAGSFSGPPFNNISPFFSTFFGNPSRCLQHCREHRQCHQLCPLDTMLHTSFLYLEKLLQESADCISCVNKQGFFSLWNRKAEELLGYTAEEAAQLHFSNVNAYKEEMTDVLRTLKEEGRVESL
jgi:PAS domain-containing protein